MSAPKARTGVRVGTYQRYAQNLNDIADDVSSTSDWAHTSDGRVMANTDDTRVAVYIDFDNIVISRYAQLHGPGQFTKDKVRTHNPRVPGADAATTTKIDQATVDIGAILDFASSFGTIVLSRAYADWSVPINASYQKQLIGRAVDLTQLFPTVQSMKNGADIRLAVDVVEDLFRLPDITHVIIVAGDSDYIALAQRSRRLGRYVIGIGVAGSTSTSLAAACDRFADYDALPGIELDVAPSTPAKPVSSAGKPPAGSPMTAAPKAKTATAPSPERAATLLLIKALMLVHSKKDEDWLHPSEVKNQMLRMDPSFSEKALTFDTFSEFLRNRVAVVELGQETPMRIKIRPGIKAQHQ